MEEWVGLQWHRFATRRAAGAHSAHEARLADCLPALTLLMHAGGAQQRIAVAAPVRVGGPRGFWQRVAGAGSRVALPQIDADVLALPQQVAVFDDASLNRDLYLWWAALAGSIDASAPWVPANLAGADAALQRFPGLRARWQALRRAELAARPRAPAPDSAELRVSRAMTCLGDGGPDAHVGSTAAGEGTADLQPADAAPVWIWLLPCGAGQAALDPAAAAAGAGCAGDQAAAAPGRRRARAARHDDARAPLLLAAKAESLKTFADPMSIDRADDDSDDGSATVAAEELETLALQRGDRASLASRVRFDLDLPSAADDDLPAGPGERLPEWSPKSRRLEPGRVQVQPLVARDAPPWVAPPALRAHAARVRQRLQMQRSVPRWQRGRPDGESIDIDAWVRAQGDASGAPDDRLYLRRTREQRELSTLLLADLSLSTDAHVNDTQRVVDVVRESLFVFGEALAGSGDAFAMLGFSSVRRTLRLHEIKGFDERWAAPAMARVGAVTPGYYTRMGAALRAGTRRLSQRPERQRLLLLLTDGKPHDLDGYEGRWGVEDTRQAVIEARRAGLLPFALSIDADAGNVMPRLFGPGGWAWVRRPAELPMRLASLYAHLTR